MGNIRRPMVFARRPHRYRSARSTFRRRSRDEHTRRSGQSRTASLRASRVGSGDLLRRRRPSRSPAVLAPTGPSSSLRGPAGSRACRRHPHRPSEARRSAAPFRTSGAVQAQSRRTRRAPPIQSGGALRDYAFLRTLVRTCPANAGRPAVTAALPASRSAVAMASVQVPYCTTTKAPDRSSRCAG
jgi:hypothetical protein